MRSGRVGTYNVLELLPKASVGRRASELLSVWSRSVRCERRVLTRNIEYTPATHIPSLWTQIEHITGERGMFFWGTDLRRAMGARRGVRSR